MARDVLQEGWLLKKKRKKMQGFAKRYFWLDHDGLLSYAVHPKARVRDSIFIHLSSVAVSRQTRAIHIDSGNMVMHIRSTSEAEFERWTSTLKRFVGKGGAVQEGKRTRRRRATAIIAGEGDEARAVDLSKMYHAVAKMSGPLKDLASVEESLRSDSALKDNAYTEHHSKFSKIFHKSHRDRDKSPGRIPLDRGDLYRRFGIALQTLRAQHAALVDSINASGDAFPVSADAADEGAPANAAVYASRTALGFQGAAATADSDADSGKSTFYDADVGIIDLDEAGSVPDAETDGEGGLESDSESNDDNVPEEERRESMDSVRTAPEAPDDGVKRRAQLPAPVSGDDMNLFSFLKKNVGKDLSTIALPISMNEPLSALQKVAEELEYSELLRKAAETDDSMDRLILVAAFAMSAFSSTKLRANRKPFNPLLGETYENVRKDKDFRFIAEKVSHHPPIMAAYADSPAGWSFTAHSAVKQKFWGRSFEIFNQGSSRLTFGDRGDVFTWNKPNTILKNIISGTKYLEHTGTMTVTNERTGEKVVLDFKGSGDKVEGKAYDSSGAVACKLNGKWDEQLSRDMGGGHFQQVFQAHEFPPDARRYYGFSRFAAELNEVTEDLLGRLPPTDSRLRPDQRAFEEGRVEEAEQGKLRVEDKQRRRRKQWEEEGREPRPPQWFEQNGDEWVYKGGYFEKRAAEKPGWEDPDIF